MCYIILFADMSNVGKVPFRKSSYIMLHMLLSTKNNSRWAWSCWSTLRQWTWIAILLFCLQIAEIWNTRPNILICDPIIQKCNLVLFGMYVWLPWKSLLIKDTNNKKCFKCNVSCTKLDYTTTSHVKKMIWLYYLNNLCSSQH